MHRMPLAYFPVGQVEVHELAPAVEYCAAAQVAHEVMILEDAWYCPAGQSTHWAPLTYVPARHIDAQLLAPALEYCPPAAQERH